MTSYAQPTDVPPVVASEPLTTPVQLTIVSLLAGAPGGAFLMYQNAKALGDEQQASQMLMLAVGLLAAILVAMYLLPSVHMFLIGVATTAACYLVAHNVQAEQIAHQVELGAEKAGLGRLVVVAIGTAVTLFAAGALAAALLGPPSRLAAQQPVWNQYQQPGWNQPQQPGWNQPQQQPTWPSQQPAQPNTW